MKKIILTASVVLATFALNAATIKWSYSGVVGTDGNKAASSNGYMAYVFCSYDSSSTLNVVSLSDAIASISSKDGISGYLGSKGPTAGMIAAQTAGSITLKQDTSVDPAVDIPETVKLYAIVLDKNEENYLVLDEKTMEIAANGSTYTFGWTSFNNKTTDWQAVPEPTSGLLLLLGVAGLALRRKQM